MPVEKIIVYVPTSPVKVIGVPGLPGQAGPAGGSAAPFVLTAGVDLSYPRIVAVDAGVAYYPDLTNMLDVQRVVGVTLQSALTGAPVQIAQARVFTENAWNWSPGAIYCDLTGGTLTQTAPTTGAVLEVGKAIDAKTISILIHRAILR